MTVESCRKSRRYLFSGRTSAARCAGNDQCLSDYHTCSQISHTDRGHIPKPGWGISAPVCFWTDCREFKNALGFPEPLKTNWSCCLKEVSLCFKLLRPSYDDCQLWTLSLQLCRWSTSTWMPLQYSVRPHRYAGKISRATLDRIIIRSGVPTWILMRLETAYKGWALCGYQARVRNTAHCTKQAGGIEGKDAATSNAQLSQGHIEK